MRPLNSATTISYKSLGILAIRSLFVCFWTQMHRHGLII